ncbi:hypothetical protein NOR53_2963 [gamma proteobacterium NOR5-3]|nr:hypothetical protein NOR53_2963 [gamma proteobacterium NOR5-3]
MQYVPSLPSKPFFGHVIAFGVMAIFVMGGILPYLVSTSYFAGRLYSEAETLIPTVLFVGLILYVSLPVLLSKQVSKRLFLPLILLSVLAVLWARYLAVFSMDQAYYSDFATMWEHAKFLSERGQWVTPNSPQQERILSSLYPLSVVFGHDDAVWKTFNIIALTLTGLLCSLLAASWISYRAALVTFWLIALNPETYFASWIPTHDIPAALYLVVYIYLFNLFVNLPRKTPVFSAIGLLLVLSLTGLALEIQRGIYPVLVVSTAIYWLCTIATAKEDNAKSGRGRRIFLAVSIPLIFVTVSKITLTNEGVLFDRQDPSIIYNTLSWFCDMNSMNDGTLRPCIRFHSTLSTDLDYDDTKFYTHAFAITDAYRNPIGKVKNFVLRLKRLMASGIQGNFYYGKMKDLSTQHQRLLKRYLGAINHIYFTFFSVLSLASFLSYFSQSTNARQARLEIQLPLLVVAITILALGLISQVQPRYLFFAPCLLAIPISGLSLEHSSLTSSPKLHSFFLVKWITFSAISLLVVLGGLYHVLATSKLLLSDARDVRIVGNNPAVNYENVLVGVPEASFHRDYTSATLQLPVPYEKGDFVAGTYSFDERKIGPGEPFLISGYLHHPYQDSGTRKSFTHQIYINETLVEELDLTNSESHYYFEHSGIAPMDGAVTLTIMVQAKSSRDKESWAKASTTFIRFVAIR